MPPQSHVTARNGQFQADFDPPIVTLYPGPSKPPVTVTLRQISSFQNDLC